MLDLPFSRLCNKYPTLQLLATCKLKNIGSPLFCGRIYFTFYHSVKFIRLQQIVPCGGAIQIILLKGKFPGNSFYYTNLSQHFIFQLSVANSKVFFTKSKENKGRGHGMEFFIIH